MPAERCEGSSIGLAVCAVSAKSADFDNGVLRVEPVLISDLVQQRFEWLGFDFIRVAA